MQMEKMVYRNSNYSLWQADYNCVGEIANFVVKENEKHHRGGKTEEEIKVDIANICNEEKNYSSLKSFIYIARNTAGKMIGCIRVFKWDGTTVLPIQKLFGIDPKTATHYSSHWHIGRFAIDSFAGIPTMTLFKQLMAMAVSPIIKDSDSCMIAETDSKLLRIMNALGIITTQLGDSIEYLSSETIPICSSRDGLLEFFQRHASLCP